MEACECNPQNVEAIENRILSNDDKDSLNINIEQSQYDDAINDMLHSNYELLHMHHTMVPYEQLMVPQIVQSLQALQNPQNVHMVNTNMSMYNNMSLHYPHDISMSQLINDPTIYNLNPEINNTNNMNSLRLHDNMQVNNMHNTFQTTELNNNVRENHSIHTSP
jgi:hypothetical protein